MRCYTARKFAAYPQWSEENILSSKITWIIHCQKTITKCGSDRWQPLVWQMKHPSDNHNSLYSISAQLYLVLVTATSFPLQIYNPLIALQRTDTARNRQPRNNDGNHSCCFSYVTRWRWVQYFHVTSWYHCWKQEVPGPMWTIPLVEKRKSSWASNNYHHNETSSAW